jgi:hypothetical protein
VVAGDEEAPRPAGRPKSAGRPMAHARAPPWPSSAAEGPQQAAPRERSRTRRESSASLARNRNAATTYRRRLWCGSSLADPCGGLHANIRQQRAQACHATFVSSLPQRAAPRQLPLASPAPEAHAGCARRTWAAVHGLAASRLPPSTARQARARENDLKAGGVIPRPSAAQPGASVFTVRRGATAAAHCGATGNVLHTRRTARAGVVRSGGVPASRHRRQRLRRRRRGRRRRGAPRRRRPAWTPASACSPARAAVPVS